MAVFERADQRIVLRVVYDGPGRAGKSTNLRHLCAAFTARRRSELVVPLERAGRTMLFDWLQLDGGLVAGHALRCQLVTVPGQARLQARRRHLLETADVVVFVCSSARRSLARSKEMLEGLRRSTGAPVPLIVQANKQDLGSAASLAEVARALSLSDDVAVVGAVAREGTGVKETAVLAIRAAAARVQKTLLEHGIDGLDGRAESVEDLLAAVARHEDPLDDVGSVRRPRRNGGVEMAVDPKPAVVVPPFPRDDAPAGCIWPATTGREVLRKLELDRIVERDDLRGQLGRHDGSGRHTTRVFRAGDWCVKTSTARRHGALDDGKAQLLALARRKIALGGWLLPSTVLCLQRGEEGEHWLWTVAPWVESLRGRMHAGEQAPGDRPLAQALQCYAEAAVGALALATRQGILLDVHPSNFAAVGDDLYYLDDDIDTGQCVDGIGHAILQRVEEYADRPPAVEAFLQAVEAALRDRLTPGEVRDLKLVESFEATIARHPEAREARDRLAQIAAELARRK